MYEAMTYEVILQRMLARIPSGFDTREGSVIYDAIAPAAAELAQMYIALDVTRDLTFIQTSSNTYLDALAAEFGLSRIQATKALVTGFFNINIPVGSRFSGGELNYKATEKISEGIYLLECETSGTAGNAYIGRLIPIEYIDGLQSAEITEISIPAIDTETDDALKARFFESIRGGAVDGNILQYKKWAAEYPGVGRSKVFPLWNGNNTVKISILNAENGAASSVLIEDFQEFLDPDSEGLGNGAAPIGAIVTVSTASEKTINVSAAVHLNDGYIAAEGVEEALEAYFNSLAYTAVNVNYYEVAVTISACDSVAQISDLHVNNTMADVSLDAEEIPVLGTLDIQVVD